MGKQKNTELNFLYMDEQKNAKKQKNIVKTKKKNTRAGKRSAQESNTFNFDNEIVIGVTKIPDERNNVTNNKKKIKTKVKDKNTKKEKNKINSSNNRRTRENIDNIYKTKTKQK